MKKLICAAAALALLTAFATSANAAPTDLRIWVEVDGSAYLENTTDGPVSFDGYQIASEGKNLDPAGWKSISDRVPAEITDLIAALGAGALTFGEANPGNANLAELNLGGVGTLPGKAKFSLGKPFINTGVAGSADGFFWSAPGTGSQTSDVVLAPEPSALVLAGFGLIGLVGLARRRRAA